MSVLAFKKGDLFGEWSDKRPGKLLLYLKDTDRIKKVGYLLVDRKIYVKQVQENKHLFKKFQAFGISTQIIDALKLYEIEKVLILGEKRDYMFRLKDFNDKYVNEGYDEQMLCRIDKEITEEK